MSTKKKINAEELGLVFSTANEFSLHIEEMHIKQNISYVEAVLKYCEENMLEPADIANLINPNLKDKIGLEMQEMNFLPKTATLDI